MQNKRNPRANCGNCPFVWKGSENFMFGVDSVIKVGVVKCTKDFKHVKEDQFCESHPEFWECSSAGIKK